MLMSKSKPLIFLCYGDAKNGFGHIRRAVSLFKFMLSKNRSLKIVGLSSESNTLLRSIIPQKNILNVNPRKISDSRILIDSPINFDDLAAVLKNRNNKIITLDYFGDINPDINIVIYPHKDVKGDITYVGFDYVIIRNEFLKFSRTTLQKTNSSVVISLGGGDVLNQSAIVAKKLLQMGFNPTIIYGPTKNKKLINDIDEISFLYNPKNFSELIYHADFVISNCGGCMFESLYFRKPTFLLPQTKREESIGQALHKLEKLVIGVGIDNLSTLLSCKPNSKISNQTSVIDGKGMQRISKILSDTHG